MDRFDYIENIYSYLRSLTGINYQLSLKEVFYSYYKYHKKTFEMPDFYGGDEKNDGAVLSEGLFYQVYAPTRLTTSLKKNIESKFKEDLDGLATKIYIEKKWNGTLKQFIFIVNTFDNNLPEDSDSFFDSTVDSIKEKYNIDFNYKVKNNDYVRDLLEDVEDINVLKSIASKLRTKHLIDPNLINEKIMMDLIIGISGNISNKLIDSNDTQTYERISTSRKITINSLENKREEIEKIISMLDVVDKTVNIINQDILYERKFDRVKTLIISKYNALSKEESGSLLFDNLVEELNINFTLGQDMLTPIKFLIVYIFDKCDIFEKEDE